MNQYLLITTIAVLLFFVEIVYFRIAKSLKIFDKPNERSSHKRSTIRGGGIIFILGVILWAIFNCGFTKYPWFVIGTLLIGAISFADDIHSVPNRYRLLIHFIAIILLLFEIGFLNFQCSGIQIALALIVATGIINAFNFMDGINGITGTYSLAFLSICLYINSNIDFVEPDLIIVSIISVIIFNYFNFRKKARCFAGDVGSVSIAFIVIFILGKLMFVTGDLSYIIFLAVYGVDTVMTIIHRLYLKENIFEAHRKHCFQLMANELKIPHLAVSTIYSSVQLAINIGLVLITEYRFIYCIAVIICLSTIYWIIVNSSFPLHLKKI